MSTLLDIKKQVAAYLTKDLADLTVNGQDLCLAAFNQVRKVAELEHDFEFNRKLVTVTVNGITGGSLTAVRDSDSNLVDVKTVIDVGLVSGSGNFIPAVWTTVAENFERQRQSNRRASPLFLTDAEAQYGTAGIGNFTFSGDQIHRWPRTLETDSTNYVLNLEVYAFTLDWTIDDLTAQTITVTGTLAPDYTGTFALAGTFNSRPFFTSATAILFYDVIHGPYWVLQDHDVYFAGEANRRVFNSTVESPAGIYVAEGSNTGNATVTVSENPTSDVWTTHGSQFLLWQTIVHLNKLFRVYVPRQEGNLPPPTDLADAGLQTLVDWDSSKYEQFRRHNR